MRGFCMVSLNKMLQWLINKHHISVSIISFQTWLIVITTLCLSYYCMNIEFNMIINRKMINNVLHSKVSYYEHSTNHALHFSIFQHFMEFYATIFFKCHKCNSTIYWLKILSTKLLCELLNLLHNLAHLSFRIFI